MSRLKHFWCHYCESHWTEDTDVMLYENSEAPVIKCKYCDEFVCEKCDKDHRESCGELLWE